MDLHRTYILVDSLTEIDDTNNCCSVGKILNDSQYSHVIIITTGRLLKVIISSFAL